MNICLYGASSKDIDGAYIEAVEKLGYEMGKRGHSLIFGGGANGLMGAAARGVFESGGSVIGVAPSFFDVDGILFQNCSEIHLTETMRERKQMMEDLADAFLTVPGGIGTFEEFFEILTLKQLGRHNKAVVIYNLDNYYEDMIGMMNRAISGGFMSKKNSELFTVFSAAEDILNYVESYVPVTIHLEELKRIN